MAKKIYIIFIVLGSFLALGTVLHFTLKAKAIVKIKWSEFKTTTEIADAVRMRLRQEAKDHNVFFLGVEPGDQTQLEIWKEWIRLNNEPGWKIDEIYVEPALPGIAHIYPQAKPLDVRQFHEQTVQIVKQTQKQTGNNLRIVFIVPHVYSSMMLKENPIHRIQTDSQIQIMAMTIVPLLTESSLKCEAAGSDYSGQSPLGCLAQEKGFFFKKKVTHTPWSGLLEQYGLSDYILFLKSNAK